MPISNLYAARFFIKPIGCGVDLPRKIRHAQLLNLTEDRAARAGHRHPRRTPSAAVTELTLIALGPSAPACRSSPGPAPRPAPISSTRRFSRQSTDWPLDTFFVSRTFERDDDELRRGDRIANCHRAGVARANSLSPRSSPPSTRPRRKNTPFDVPAQVSIDNELSNRYTVIEVSGRDRPGLLYAITDILSQLNLNIASAHIVTFGEKALYVFYVTDLTGAKITTSGRRSAIRQKLLTAFPGQAPAKPRGGRGKSPAMA